MSSITNFFIKAGQQIPSVPQQITLDSYLPSSVSIASSVTLNLTLKKKM